MGGRLTNWAVRQRRGKALRGEVGELSEAGCQQTSHTNINQNRSEDTCLQHTHTHIHTHTHGVAVTDPRRCLVPRIINGELMGLSNVWGKSS